MFPGASRARENEACFAPFSLIANDFPVNVTFYGAEAWVPRVSWIPNKHYSGVYGLLKLILPDALRVERALVLDTDVTVLSDVYPLWRMFARFSAGQTLGLVENQSNWYVKTLSYGQRPWPALGRGFNTGIMLMHLQRLRDGRFASAWESVTKRVLGYIPETSLADQDVINAMIDEQPDIVHRIECTWNIQLSDHTLSDACYRDADRINVRHSYVKFARGAERRDPIDRSIDLTDRCAF